MKLNKFSLVLASIVVLCFFIFMLLNIKVSTRQGINYEWHNISMPLYLKLIDFFDRHYNYQELVKRIIKGKKTDQERVLRLFEWTHENIKKVPYAFPIIDDHVWNIIVRGYGTNDQSSDVFTTLCNYAGIDAFFTFVQSEDFTKRIPLSFVKLEKKWYVFDPYNGVYFKNKDQYFASIEQIKNGNWRRFFISEENRRDYDYSEYFKNLSSIGNIGLKRANIQSPLRRFMFEVKKLVNNN
ncbi:MAG: transglutaminase domain-containing protein [Candidatus Omnitrophota bacterium]